MARDTKVGMLLGLGIILLVGIFVSDYLRPAENPPAEAATGFAGAAMDRGRESFNGQGQSQGSSQGSSQAPVPASRTGFVPLAPQSAPRPTPGDDMARGPQGFSAPLPAWRAAPPSGGSAEATATPAFAVPAPLLLEPSEAESLVADPRLGVRGGQRSLLVRTGDTLDQLAFELYGATGYAEALAAANPHAIDVTGRPVPGSTLIVPDYAGLVAHGRASVPPAPAAGQPSPPEVLILPPPARDLRPAVTVVDPAPTPAQSYFEVTVEPGDTLSRLASKHLGDARRFEELFEANRDQLRSPDSVQLGMVLRIPREGSNVASGSTAGPAQARSSVAGVATYTVRPGDSLSRIAARVLGDADRWEELFEANRDTLASPDRVVVGQELRVPG